MNEGKEKAHNDVVEFPCKGSFYDAGDDIKKIVAIVFWNERKEIY